MPNQALEQTRDSVLRYGEVVGCELLNFFVSPENMEAEYDPSGVEELSWALWAVLMCQCDRCDTYLDLGHDALLDESPKEWADLVAPIAKAKGWTAPDEFTVRCPQCSKVSSK